ncbi:SLC13 family permease [Cupriavidus sp. RAF12]|uniref:SLC13 family permease n=1 Tax=Cupriavidus sp. RAF12 TaxID=3233050 RepID=UPI003F90FA33
MLQHIASISVLGLMFVIATVLPVNMGALAFVGAFLVGTFLGAMPAKTILMGFPADLFLTLVGITYLFAVAQNNGTIDWLVRLAVRAVGGRIAAIPWIMFGIAALLTSVGAVSPAAVAIIAPIALGFAARYKINPLMMGLMVIHGAQGGGFSPISIYGGITNKIVEKAGLPLNEMATAFASLGVNLLVALGLFIAFGGLRLMRGSEHRQPAVVGNGVAAIDLPFQARTTTGGAGGTAIPAADGARVEAEQSGTPYQYLTVLGLVALSVLTLYLKLDIGFVSLSIAVLLTLVSPNLQKAALTQVSWPEIMLIVGVSTYVGVMEKMGTISFVGHSVAGMTSPMMAALLLCFVGAVISAFASSTAVLGSLIPLAVPFLQQGSDVSAIGFIAAMAVSSTIVDVSPFSTNGALVLANAQGVDRHAFFRKLMVYGALVTIVAPVVLWFSFVVL